MPELTLLQKQKLFCSLVAKLISWSYDSGYELTFGEVLRTKLQAQANAASGAGISNSLHLSSLAVDLNLFIEGEYQRYSEAYKPLGDYWKSLHPLCCWGGDFKSRPDGNHFSLTHGGVK